MGCNAQAAHYIHHRTFHLGGSNVVAGQFVTLQHNRMDGKGKVQRIVKNIMKYVAFTSKIMLIECNSGNVISYIIMIKPTESVLLPVIWCMRMYDYKVN